MHLVWDLQKGKLPLVPGSSIFPDSEPQALGMQVLVVEDEPISRRALAALLSDSGYRPLSASSAEEALVLLTEGKRPGLALIDLDLPGMNGLELIRWLRRLAPHVVPILVTATSRERINLLLHHEHQEILYLRKPINFDQLLIVLEEHRTGR